METSRLYGRASGPKLRARPKRLLETLYPKLEVASGPIDPARLFGRQPEALWLEVGFGKGEHMVAHASSHPGIGYIGCEPYLNGMAAALGLIEDQGLDNIRLWRGDAALLLAALPEASLDRLFVLHPDPWPKYRHAKRRFIGDDNMAAAARALKPGGLLRIGTDHPVYLRWALMVMARQPHFEWLAEKAADWQQRPADWPPTRYEQWALGEGRPVWYLQYRRC
jgi:tRNA (guanine-N7-)-methyltransferase